MSLTRRTLVTRLSALAPVTAALAATNSHAQIDRDAAAALRRLEVGNERLPGCWRAKPPPTWCSPRSSGLVSWWAAPMARGALRRGGQTIGDYNSAAASYGLQAGVQ